MKTATVRGLDWSRIGCKCAKRCALCLECDFVSHSLRDAEVISEFCCECANLPWRVPQ